MKNLDREGNEYYMQTFSDPIPRTFALAKYRCGYRVSARHNKEQVYIHNELEHIQDSTLKERLMHIHDARKYWGMLSEQGWEREKMEQNDIDELFG